MAEVTLVSGAGGGIGSAIVRRLRAEGRAVVAVDRNEAALQSLKDEEGDDLRCFVLDITNEEAVSQFVAEQEQAVETLALVNAAGIFHAQPVEDIPLSKLHEAWNVNVLAKLILMRAVIPFMKERRAGYIVNIASVAGLRPFPNESLYNATMYAVVGLTEAIHEELKPHGVHVSAVAPGMVDTPLARRGFQLTDEQWQQVLQPEEVASEVWHHLTAGPNEFRRVTVLEPRLVF